MKSAQRLGKIIMQRICLPTFQRPVGALGACTALPKSGSSHGSGKAVHVLAGPCQSLSLAPSISRSLVWGTRQRHCAAIDESSSPPAATAAPLAAAPPSPPPEQQQDSSQDVSELTASEVAHKEAAGTPEAAAVSVGISGSSVDEAWSSFLQVLWERGYFDEHSSDRDMDAAISSRRDIKKALQQFARCRPDIVLRLPQKLLTELATQKYPEKLEKKTRIAVERLQADTAKSGGKQGPAHATGRASTQDILRAMWGLTNTSPGSTTATAATAAAAGDDSSQAGPIAGVLARCGLAVLSLEQQPADAELVKAAEAAMATSNAASYQQHQSDSAAAVAKRGEARESGSSREGTRGDREGTERRSSRQGQQQPRRGIGEKREQQLPPFPRSEDPVVQHKLRLLKSAPYTEMRAGDWFCGECGAHNYAFKQTCFRCEVPSNSLGASKVTLNDVRQLQQIGLGQAMVYEQRQAAALYTIQVAGQVTAALSIPAAAKAAGQSRFKLIKIAPEQGQEGDKISDSSSQSSGKADRGSDRRDSGSYSLRPSGLRDHSSPQGQQNMDRQRDQGTSGGRDKGLGDRPSSRRSREGQGQSGGSGQGDVAAPRRGLFGAEPVGGSSAAAGSNVGLADAFKEAFADLEAELSGSSSAARDSTSDANAGKTQQRSVAEQQQQVPDSPTGTPKGEAAAAAATKRVRRLRTAPADAEAAEIVPAAAESDSSREDDGDDLSYISSGGSWRREERPRRGEAASSRRGYDSPADSTRGGRRGFDDRADRRDGRREYEDASDRRGGRGYDDFADNKRDRRQYHDSDSRRGGRREYADASYSSRDRQGAGSGRQGSSPWGAVDAGDDLSGWAEDYSQVVGGQGEGRAASEGRPSARRSIVRGAEDEGRSSRSRGWEDRGEGRAGRSNSSSRGWEGRGEGRGGRRDSKFPVITKYDEEGHVVGTYVPVLDREGRLLGGKHLPLVPGGDRDDRQAIIIISSSRGDRGFGGSDEASDRDESGWYKRSWERRDGRGRDDRGRGGGGRGGGGRGGRGRGRRDSRGQGSEKPSWAAIFD